MSLSPSGYTRPPSFLLPTAQGISKMTQGLDGAEGYRPGPAFLCRAFRSLTERRQGALSPREPHRLVSPSLPQGS